MVCEESHRTFFFKGIVLYLFAELNLIFDFQNGINKL